MRQSDRLKHNARQRRAPERQWSIILLGISGAGTFLATNLLVFDCWVDALAIYVASGLTLTLLLCRLGTQQTASYGDGSANEDRERSGIFGPSSIFGRPPVVRLDSTHRPSRPEVTVAPAALGEPTPTD